MKKDKRFKAIENAAQVMMDLKSWLHETEYPEKDMNPILKSISELRAIIDEHYKRVDARKKPEMVLVDSFSGSETLHEAMDRFARRFSEDNHQIDPKSVTIWHSWEADFRFIDGVREYNIDGKTGVWTISRKVG